MPKIIDCSLKDLKKFCWDGVTKWCLQCELKSLLKKEDDYKECRVFKIIEQLEKIENIEI